MLPVERRRGEQSSSYAGDTTTNELAEALSELARSLQSERTLDDTLRGITRAAVETVPGAHHAGISEVQGRRKVLTRAGTAEVVSLVDKVQYETGQGPCLDAIYQEQTVRLADMAAEPRWPEFTGRALDLGIRGMLSFKLYVRGNNLGALTLYAERPHAFSDESEYVGLLFASHAAVAMIGARQQQNADQALRTRDLIGQAKGILMERHRITADRAFDLMIAASQRTNSRLTTIAQHLADSGEFLGPAS